MQTHSTDWNSEVNRRIEEIRIRRNIPRTIAARAAGIKPDTYRNRILEGRAFTIGELAAITEAIDVDLVALVSGINTDIRKGAAA